MKEVSAHCFLVFASTLDVTFLLCYFLSRHTSLGIALGKMLAQNARLETLGLRDNLMGDDAAHGLAAGLKQNSCLEVLSIDGNAITETGATALFQAMS
jgi:hypothetical protein